MPFDQRNAATWLSDESVVFDASGKELGKVTEVSESYFKLDISMGFDYWLPYHLIDRADGGQIHLTVNEDALDKEKVDARTEDLTSTEVEESVSDTNNPVPMERRYEAQAEYLTHPHPPV